MATSKLRLVSWIGHCKVFPDAHLHLQNGTAYDLPCIAYACMSKIDLMHRLWHEAAEVSSTRRTVTMNTMSDALLHVSETSHSDYLSASHFFTRTMPETG